MSADNLCHACSGVGWVRSGPHLGSKCFVCRGSGREPPDPDDMAAHRTTCENCQGRGHDIGVDQCFVCRGKGYTISFRKHHENA